MEIYDNDESLVDRISNWIKHKKLDKENYKKILKNDKTFDEFHALMIDLLDNDSDEVKELKKIIRIHYGTISHWADELIKEDRQNPTTISAIEHFDYCFGIAIDILGLTILEELLDKQNPESI